MDVDGVRARSFGTHAAGYAQHRPEYPADGVRWALGAAHRPVHDVLDLAAGTGKLTAGLLPLGVAVTAVEPDDEMRGLLEHEFPEVDALAGTAEEIPLPDESVDAVVVGQAFHWFDRERALDEIARVLRPAGGVGALWNGEDDSVEWVAELMAVTDTSVAGVVRDHLWVPEHARFEAFEESWFPNTHRRTIDSLAETFGTHSHMLVIPRAERDEAMERIRTFLRARPETSAGEFDMPLVTKVLRATRS